MKVQLGHVFAGETGRRGKPQRQPTVDHRAVEGFEDAIMGMAGGGKFADQSGKNISGLGTGQTPDGDSGFTWTAAQGEQG